MDAQCERTQVEDALARMWADVLKRERVGPDENFFELGGQSVSALTLFEMVGERFAIELPLFTIFQFPTIRELARRICESVPLEQPL